MGDLKTQVTYITSLVLCGSPTPSHLMSGGGDGTVYVWKLDTQERVHKIKAHNAEVTSLAIHPSGMITLLPLAHKKTFILLYSKKSFVQVVLRSQLVAIRRSVCGICSQASKSVIVLCQ